MLQKMLLIGGAGALGALARYGLAGVVQRLGGAGFPWGTVAVNIFGCFLAGLLFSLFESRWTVSGETRAAVMIGFLGAFTTFSTYMLETEQLVRNAEWLHAGANLALQNGLGFAALIAGAALGRLPWP